MVADIRKFCEDFHLDHIREGHHHTTRNHIQVHCPWCSDGRNGFHLGFNLEHGNLNCWRCGSHSFWEYVGAILNTSNKRLIAQIVNKYKGRAEQFRQKPIIRKQIINPPPGTSPLISPHKKYLRSRGFKPISLTRDWGLQGTKHLSGEWNWRIIIPIHNQQGEIVSYIGRAINEEMKPKYKFIPNEDMLRNPRSLLYGLHKVPGDSIIIVEGPADVWRIGFGAVGLLGIDWKIPQAEILRTFQRRFVLFDPGKVAQKRAYKLAKWLSAFPGETEILSDLPYDPGKMSMAEVKNLRKEIGFAQ